MNDFKYDSAQTRASKDLVSQWAAPEATRAARRSGMMASSQNERRWGVEAGALAYKAQYEKNLNALHDDFHSLAEQLRVFVEALEHTVTSLESHEDDVVAAQRALMKRLESPEPSAPIPDALKDYYKGPGLSDGDPMRPYAPSLGRAKEV